MRRSSRSEPNEGAVLVWVALMVTVLLGVGALTIDLGALYAEKRDLQNGADAAALAIAQDCAQGNCGSPVTRAKQYADLNAQDHFSAIDFVCGSASGASPGLSACTDPGQSGVSGWVRVRTSTLGSDGRTAVPFLLAPIMNALTEKTVRATATAAWGPMGKGTLLPFTISKCEYAAMGGVVGGAFPTGTSTIYSDTTDPGCSPGATPGNFGWLDQVQCMAKDVTGGSTFGGSTGNSNQLCSSTEALIKATTEPFVIPIYSRCSPCNGSKAVFTIAGFVGYRIVGYKLSGGGGWGTVPDRCPNPDGSRGSNSLRCFQGIFTKVTTTGDIGSGSTDFGARVIKMVG